VELTALGTWIGGLVILIGAVIPAVFNTFGGQDSGGFFLTRAFDGYNRIVLIAGAVLTLGTVGRAWLNRRGVIGYPVSTSEWNVLGLMVLIAGAIMFVLHPQAAALQAQAFATNGEPARKIAFDAFFRLHWPIRILYVVNMGLGIVLLGIRIRSWLERA
jgi:hypothetical protein